MLPYNGNLKQYSRQLRENMTDAERNLWAKIRMKQIKGYQFYRQKPIGEMDEKDELELRHQRTREKLRAQLQKGQLDDRMVEIDVSSRISMKSFL